VPRVGACSGHASSPPPPPAAKSEAARRTGDDRYDAPLGTSLIA
jgi:hypothetical protein